MSTNSHEDIGRSDAHGEVERYDLERPHLYYSSSTGLKGLNLQSSYVTMSSRRRKHYVVRYTSVDNGPSEAGLEVPQTPSPESDDAALSEALCILTPPLATPFPDAPSLPLAISSSVISPMTLSATLRIASGAPNLKGSNSMGDTVARFSSPRLCVDHTYLFDSLSKSFPLSLSRRLS